MKRIIIFLCAALLLSIFLIAKYESSSHLKELKIRSFVQADSRFHNLHKTDSLSNTERGWANTLMKLNINTDVVFYGDSFTRYSDFHLFFPQLSICNLGCNEDGLNSLIRRVEMIELVHPKKIFLMGGINNSSYMSLDKYKQKYDLLFTLIQKRNPESKIYIESLLPLNPRVYDVYCDNQKVKQINTVLKDVALEHHLVFIDLYSVYEKDGLLPMEVSTDGIHLKKDCYDKWAHAIEEYIYE